MSTNFQVSLYQKSCHVHPRSIFRFAKKQSSVFNFHDSKFIDYIHVDDNTKYHRFSFSQFVNTSNESDFVPCTSPSCTSPFMIVAMQKGVCGIPNLEIYCLALSV